MPDPPNAKPGPDRRFTTDDFLGAITAVSGTATTGKIADRVGCSNDLALQRLHALAEQGVIERENVGNAYLWHRSDANSED